MDNDIWIVSQGPLNFTFTQEILAYYQDTPNMVFSSWEEDTSGHVLDLIKALNHHNVIKSRDGLVIGRAHLNLQCQSVLNGIKYAKERGAKYIFKTRSDLTIPNIEKLAQVLTDKYKRTGKPNLLCWDDKPECKQTGDLMFHGSVEDAELFWNIDEHLTIDGFAERIIIHEWMRKKGIVNYKMEYESISQYFNYILTEVEKMGLTINWLKYKDRDPLFPKHLSRQNGFKY